MTFNFSRIAPFVLRLGLAGVFVWFGASQLSTPGMWIPMVPEWAVSLGSLSASTLVHINGWLEIILGSLLAIGIYVRWTALILFLHLIIIVQNLGVNAIGVRDFGLSFATLASSLFGKDDFSVL